MVTRTWVSSPMFVTLSLAFLKLCPFGSCTVFLGMLPEVIVGIRYVRLLSAGEAQFLQWMLFTLLP